MPEEARPLDSTDTTQILIKVKDWINGLNVLPTTLNLEYADGYNGYGFTMKSDGGIILSEDILGNFTGEIPFVIFSAGQAIIDATNTVFKPLNDLGAYFRKNNVLNLSLGTRRTPTNIKMIRSPTDPYGPNDEGNIIFIAQFTIEYDENIE